MLICFTYFFIFSYRKMYKYLFLLGAVGYLTHPYLLLIFIKKNLNVNGHLAKTHLNDSM